MRDGCRVDAQPSVPARYAAKQGIWTEVSTEEPEWCNHGSLTCAAAGWERFAEAFANRTESLSKRGNTLT